MDSASGDVVVHDADPGLGDAHQTSPEVGPGPEDAEVTPLDGGAWLDGGVVEEDGGSLEPIEGPGECAWAPGVRPSAALPDQHDDEYIIELERWGISNQRGDPIETRARLNEAIAWATESGFNKVVVPPGIYLVGEDLNAAYAGGIDLPGDLTFELSAGAVLEMAANDRPNYCVINLNDSGNVTLRGGEVRGDRADHVYAGGGAHDEGHGVCVWTGVDRVLIEGVELHELTGDGVLVLGRRGDDATPDEPSTNITIRDNHIHHNRRQGISVVGGHGVVIEGNHIHHIEGTAPQFGVDIEGAGRTDQDILIFGNHFHHNAGGDVVTASGRNVWIESNSMIQCQVTPEGAYDPALPCELERQVDGPIIHWKETDSVIMNNVLRMSMNTVNGRWGILGYTHNDGPARRNPVGNYIAGNTLFDAGIHMVHNMRYFVANNTINHGLMLGYMLGCTRLEGNQINQDGGENYKLRHVAGQATGNVLNRAAGAPPEGDRAQHFPMADDAPYRNSSPVFWKRAEGAKGATPHDPSSGSRSPEGLRAAGAARGRDGARKSGGCPAGARSGGMGPEMVRLPEGFCIDTTEVTRGQYQAWLDTTPSVDGQGGPCVDNDDFTPSCAWPPGGDGDLPVVCVDWCDASAYCAAAGKRLCGHVADGGAYPFDRYDDPAVSEWQAACSSGGMHEYTYGDQLDTTLCRGADAEDYTTWGLGAAGSFPSCHSPEAAYRDVYDLSGNAAEWDQGCDGEGAEDPCRIRGGSFQHNEHGLRCAMARDLRWPRTRRVSAVGVRCCAD